uniref:Uncharacterized protein n=1 Tax=Triticum urartu TaxID=4572 RepID=A0A8R7P801_TRIUA
MELRLRLLLLLREGVPAERAEAAGLGLVRRLPGRPDEAAVCPPAGRRRRARLAACPPGRPGSGRTRAPTLAAVPRAASSLV